MDRLNLKLYNLACLVLHTIEWKMFPPTRLNYALETEMVHPLQHSAIPHCPTNKLIKFFKNNVLIKEKVIEWLELRKGFYASSYLSWYLLTVNNIVFPQREDHDAFKY